MILDVRDPSQYIRSELRKVLDDPFAYVNVTDLLWVYVADYRGAVGTKVCELLQKHNVPEKVTFRIIRTVLDWIGGVDPLILTAYKCTTGCVELELAYSSSLQQITVTHHPKTYRSKKRDLREWKRWYEHSGYVLDAATLKVLEDFAGYNE